MKNIFKSINFNNLKVKFLKNKGQEDQNNQKNRKIKLGGIGSNLSFRTKLIVGFMVPVILIVIVGITAYNRAKSALISNYEETTHGNMVNSSLYFNLMLKDIEAKSSQIASNNDLLYYYTQYGRLNDAELKTYNTNVKNTMANIQQSTDGIYNIYVLGKNGMPIYTTLDEPKSDAYQIFSTSEDVTKWNETAKSTGGRKAAWMGYHLALDDMLRVDSDTFVRSDYYAASYIRGFSKGEGFIILDLDKAEVEKALKSSISNDDEIIAFVTVDGRVTAVTGKGISQKDKEKLPDITNQSFYKKAVQGEAQSGYDYINYRGARSLFVYAKVGSTGTMVYSIIPESAIYENLGFIKPAIFVIVVIACIIAVLIGLYLTNDIRIIIARFAEAFRQISNGNLTVRMNTTRKDEFGNLANDLDKMMESMQRLVSDMANFSNRVTNAAVNVSVASSEILDAVNGIYDITKLMEQGINDQRQDIEKSYAQMSNFAEQINEAYEDTRVVDELADNTQVTVKNGKDTVNELMKQVTSTAEITQNIIADIKQLQEHSKNIGTVVETINDIASTTELLSLNASIEAVRSGDAGRGFAVIAAEIRKLAEQSMNSVKSIEHMIVSIQNMTKKTSTLADTANDMLKTQAASLNNTVRMFADIESHMINLMDKINNIMQNMQDIMVTKDGILDLIRNIAAVSEETVASSEDVASTVGRQVTSVETLEKQSNNLKDQALELKHAIDKFVIE